MMCSGAAARSAKTPADIEVSDIPTSSFLTSLLPGAGETARAWVLGLDRGGGPVGPRHGFVDHRHVGREHERVLPLGLGVGPGADVGQPVLIEVVVDGGGRPGLPA